MEDQGFNGAGSRFNSRFESGTPILAKQLNDLSAGVQASLPMPYLGDGSIVSYTPGGSLITPTDNDIGKGTAGGYLNQFHCELYKDVATDEWRLQIVNGTLIFGNEHQAEQETMTVVAPTVPSTVTIVDGGDSSSAYMNNGGYYVIDTAADYGVYLFQIQSNDAKKFINYVYVASTDDYNYPSTDFVAYGGSGQEPKGILVPLTDWTLQVLSIAYITYDLEAHTYSLSQELIGSQTLPAIQPPIQFKVDVINREQDITAAPNWTLRVARGTVMYSPEPPSTCIGVEWINNIDSNCGPYTGAYADSRWTNNGGGIEGLDNSIDYDVYLFKITQDGVSDYVLWAGDNADYTNECPVVLPTNITPSGDYVAQAIHIANVTQPTTADVWVVEQVVQGTITFPAYAPDVCTPFKVRKKSSADGSTDYEICEGMVNNIIPSNIADPVTVGDGEEVFIWVAIGVLDGTPPTFPDPDNVTIDSGADIPDDTDEMGYIGIAHIQTDGTVSQLISGSVWASRIKIGDDTAIYYYAGV